MTDRTEKTYNKLEDLDIQARDIQELTHALFYNGVNTDTEAQTRKTMQELKELENLLIKARNLACKIAEENDINPEDYI